MGNLTFHRTAKVPPKEETVISLSKLGAVETKQLAAAIAKAMPPAPLSPSIPSLTNKVVNHHMPVHSALASLAKQGLKMVHADCQGGQHAFAHSINGPGHFHQTGPAELTLRFVVENEAALSPVWDFIGNFKGKHW